MVNSFLPGGGKSLAAQGTLEEKLTVLARCGMDLAPPFTAEDLLTSWPREQFEKPGWSMVLFGLGMTEERRLWRNHCENVWRFDNECIADGGDYVRKARRMSELTRGSLVLEDIRDHVDVRGQIAWLEFKWRGNQYHTDCKVNNDWFDLGIFDHFVKLLRRADPAKVYLSYYDPREQNFIIVCVTLDEFAELQREGVSLKPL